ncbi:3'-phosphoesterase [Streptomyces sp. PTM05]|uniref:3'-phosphoesterase n=1 Tax=Streptantibioticus parmotrematis TaxID=2873249 RepID=A0ABS7QND7_9ACTN|nr:DNA polymerase ligase N-terminal domain-containing protein [Streptantibioticus parmotrematis]MBY8883319.1 3'-phosphoesterase [Streptantibioticus parmotrematis]
MATRRDLAEYHRKRDFARTGEPKGANDAGPPREGTGDGAFVVQLHEASTTHFDFRLEADGVLKSWAVPKGVSTDPGDKRLAVPTEDHPLEYGDFEGVIAAGEYGGGTVMVWDTGDYRNLSKRHGEPIPLADALEHGHAAFWLDGDKLHGGYALTRLRDGAWLLVKERDKHASSAGSPPHPHRMRSALTRRTLGQIAADEDAER